MTNIERILLDPIFLELGIAERKTYDRGTTIVFEGSDERGLYVLLKGSARVSERVELENQRHIQPGLCDLQKGDVFGELSLFEEAPRSASVIALEACELLLFDAKRLVDYFDQHPDQGYLVLRDLLQILSSRLRQTDKRLGSLFAWGLKVHEIDHHLK